MLEEAEGTLDAATDGFWRKMEGNQQDPHASLCRS
jgi:hypothetical protein